MTTARRWRGSALFVAVLSSCTCGEGVLDDTVFQCTTDDDCVAPHRCGPNRTCVAPSSEGGGQGGGTAGSGGGSGGGMGGGDAQTCSQQCLYGRVCDSVSMLCICKAGGAVVQSQETLCADGSDNDCNGTSDCLDPSCASQA